MERSTMVLNLGLWAQDSGLSGLIPIEDWKTVQKFRLLASWEFYDFCPINSYVYMLFKFLSQLLKLDTSLKNL